MEEEFEVLESIYPTELSKSSERDLQIEIEPDDIDEGIETVKLLLSLHYPPGYPDVLPEFTLDLLNGDIEDQGKDALLHDLQTAGEENLGMAMTFTLVSHLRERLSSLIRQREEKRKLEEKERERRELEEEEARTRGTPVTRESFLEWKKKFDRGAAANKAKEEDEKLKGLSAKEREEWKKIANRLTGRQLFERNKNLEDESLMEEGTVSVDVSQYERVRDRGDEEEDEQVTFSDSE